ncbi:hypothetical protein H0H87_012326 [Tephrocybe sp. NHM501043]|nr:hypothetical protein H0H87_012326 [Tephrocybe sp. NHM501043]
MRNLPERLNAAFQSVLDFNPKTLVAQKKSQCPKLTHPLTFYDTHLDKRLSLKKVASIPSFLTDLSLAVDTALEETKKDDVGLPSVEKDFPTSHKFGFLLDRAPIRDAKDLGRMYLVNISLFASRLASTLLLHPNAANWATTIDMTLKEPSRREKLYPLFDGYVLKVLASYRPAPGETLSMIEKDAWDALSDLEQTHLGQVKERFPVIGIWQMFFVQDALKHLDRLLSVESFPEILPLALVEHWPTSEAPLSASPDATATTWGASVSSWIGLPENAGNKKFKEPTIRASLPLRRSIRTTKSVTYGGSTTREKAEKASKPEKKPKASLYSIPPISSMVQHWPNVTIPTEKRDLNVVDEDMTASIVQHAWAQAVENDSTYIIFHCGAFERIAFRHRASQTLFFSDSIDIARCKDPGYGHIQIGLYMAILADARDRTLQIISEENKNTPAKRKREAREQESNKRPRTRAAIAAENMRKLDYERNFKAVFETLTDRNLALLRIQHGPYNSPAPSSLLRVVDGAVSPKSDYKPHEYFRITLTSTIACGTTGDAHRATIDLLGLDGKTLSLPDVVAKLAFTVVQRKRLRHEFEVYSRLMTAGAQGVPRMFGLYEDVETEALALVMEHAGVSLWDCRLPDKTQRLRLSISESEKVGFLNALQSIHAAGVRHRDLRIENLTINHDGYPRIIDFDRAALEADESSRQREYEQFQALFDGRYEHRLSKESDSGEVDSTGESETSSE